MDWFDTRYIESVIQFETFSFLEPFVILDKLVDRGNGSVLCKHQVIIYINADW